MTMLMKIMTMRCSIHSNLDTNYFSNVSDIELSIRRSNRMVEWLKLWALELDCLSLNPTQFVLISYVVLLTNSTYPTCCDPLLWAKDWHKRSTLLYNYIFSFFCVTFLSTCSSTSLSKSIFIPISLMRKQEWQVMEKPQDQHVGSGGAGIRINNVVIKFVLWNFRSYWRYGSKMKNFTLWSKILPFEVKMKN